MARAAMSPSRKATIYDIARLSGTSASTVSAALSDTWRDRRISAAKVEEIREIATAQGYSTNMQARALRQARSGLVGMIIPEHDNRFFASLSHAFEASARDRGLVPVIASTLRDPREEQRVIGTLIRYAVEYVLIAGATDPAAIHDQCRIAGLRHVFVDLPGIGAPSVISDNHAGAAALARRMLADGPVLDGTPRGRMHFLGGIAADHATRARIAGFRAVMAEAGLPVADDQVIACGYAPAQAAAALAALHRRLGGLPGGLLLNSMTVFEGALQHFVTLQADDLRATVFGCYDYAPLGAWLQFPVHMVRQNAAALVSRAYEMIESGLRGPVVEEVLPDLIPPRTVPALPSEAEPPSRGQRDIFRGRRRPPP